MSARKIFTLIHIIIITCFLGFLYIKYIMPSKAAAPVAVDIKTLDKKPVVIRPEVTMQTEEISFPKELNLKVPFYTQAPESNWDYPWQEACEEASLLLISNALQEKNWSRDEFKDQLLSLIDYENKEFGDYKHTNLAQNQKILKDYLGLKYTTVKNPTFEDVQSALNKGHLVMMTFAGKRLGNPNYKNGGPNYHAMVIKGYSKDNIVTNDVGTRKGEDYVYSWDTINYALHDWAEPIENGAKVMLEISI